MEYIHKPVLLDECIAMLNIRPDGVYIDGTLGRAGHSKEIARRLTTGRLVCIDQDLAAIRAAEELLAPWRDRVTLVHGNFSDLADILHFRELALPAVMVAVNCVAVNYVLGFLLYKTNDLDLPTSLFASVPAGMSDMALVSLEQGGEAPKVAVLQLVQIGRAHV